ncbi:hypothetical protein HPB52_007437 [Rhipicephalus sanguineus]|uniref:Peptidase M13 N-terminal domain-containing protein n=1 Tax=Rhipicephalus sanguineus TaxID=34632 RepID=A0A9D4SNL3_RHISA|nr:hypothetical protein HPB52_007437 [Rhipicephalus sanguineus]
MINESLNTSVDPCEDFYSYACGGWMENHPIPAEKSALDSFSILNDELRDTLRDLLENITLVDENQTIVDKLGLFYNSCVGRKQLINQNTTYSRPIIAAYKNVIQVAMKFMKPNLSDEEVSDLTEKLVAYEGQLANATTTGVRNELTPRGNDYLG